MSNLLAQANFFGNIAPPPGVTRYQTGVGAASGLVNFLSNLIKLVIVGGGIFTFINILLAGVSFISAGGDPKKIEQATTKIWQSGIGLIIMAGSFVAAAIIGQIIFGDPSFILVPRIHGPD